MLSNQTIEIVNATAPVVADNAEALTRHFYKRMFSHNPEVLPYFNQAHQREGRQQKALAGAICAYAANIDRLEVLGPAVELIAQKHASLQIRPEHYPIVGANLLESIREVLGEAATDDIINAWGEAYGFLAQILTSREQAIYEEQANAEGGWSDFKEFKVLRKKRESDLITSFYLVPTDGKPVPRFKAGQYITVRVPTADGRSKTMRNYSLSDSPGKPWFRISVKREEGPTPRDPVGYVSHYLHQMISEGSTLELAAPCGEFVWDSESSEAQPLVFIAAGVGITPIASMLGAAVAKEKKPPITLIHAVRNKNVQAFQSVFTDWAKTHPEMKVHFRYSEEGSPLDEHRVLSSTGFVDESYLDQLALDPKARYYLCGPGPFIESVKTQLIRRGTAETQIHYEYFGPKL